MTICDLLKRTAALLLCCTIAVLSAGCGDEEDETSSKARRTVPEHWQKSRVNENQAADEAVKALLKAADDSDKEAFGKCFADKLRCGANFNDYADDFFSEYPAGMSECKLSDGSVASSGSFDYGHNIQTASASYDCELEGEHYFITLCFCFENTDEPEKVGVTYFAVRDLAATAVYRSRDTYCDDEDDTYSTDKPCTLCERMSGSGVEARLIDGSAYLWKETGNEALSADEMRALLDQVTDLKDEKFINTAGYANVEYKFRSATGYDYFYELKSENGESRYARIATSSPYGRIIDAYLCTPSKTIYDDPLCSFRRADD